jgi:hypothetical protein
MLQDGRRFGPKNVVFHAHAQLHNEFNAGFVPKLISTMTSKYVESIGFPRDCFLAAV